MFKKFLMLMALLVFVLSQEAVAWSRLTCTTSNNVTSNHVLDSERNGGSTLYLGDGFTQGSVQETEMIAAVVQVNANSSGFRYTNYFIGNLTNLATAAFDAGTLPKQSSRRRANTLGNFLDEVYFSSDTSLTGGLAAMLYWYNTSNCNLYDKDIVFAPVPESSSWSYTRNTEGLVRMGGTARPFIATAMHELGHKLGLAHESRLINLMGQDFNYYSVSNGGDMIEPTIGHDAQVGIVAMHGALSGGSHVDYSIWPWRYANFVGEYATSVRSPILDENGSVVRCRTIGNQTCAGGSSGSREEFYDVVPGGWYQTAFTLQGMGANTDWISHKTYLSLDKNITTQDRQLTRWTSDKINSVVDIISVKEPYETTQTLIQIPTDLESGDYYVGMILDENNEVAEFNEINNVAYIGIHVVAPSSKPGPAPSNTPIISSPANGSTLDGSNVTFNWAANGLTVNAWEMIVGSAQDGYNFYSSGALSGSTTSATVTGLPTDGSMVYVRLRWAVNGVISTAYYTYTTSDSSASSSSGGIPAMSSPVNGSTLGSSNATFNWAANGLTVNAWEMIVGSVQDGYNFYSSGALSGSTTSATVTGLPTDGSMVYVRLRWAINGVISTAYYTYTTSGS